MCLIVFVCFEEVNEMSSKFYDEILIEMNVYVMLIGVTSKLMATTRKFFVTILSSYLSNSTVSKFW